MIQNFRLFKIPRKNLYKEVGVSLYNMLHKPTQYVKLTSLCSWKIHFVTIINEIRNSDLSNVQFETLV